MALTKKEIAEITALKEQVKNMGKNQEALQKDTKEIKETLNKLVGAKTFAGWILKITLVIIGLWLTYTGIKTD